MSKEWLEISHQVSQVHAKIEESINRLIVTLNRANSAAEQSDPEGIGFAMDACKMQTKLCHSVYYLGAAGILDDETCNKFKHALEAHCTGEYEKLFMEYSKCVGETGAEVLRRLVQGASELDPKHQKILVNLAQQVREIENLGRQSPD